LIDTAVPELMLTAVNVYVSVVPASDTLPPVAAAAGVTVPTAGVPAVPAGTVIVTEDSVEVDAVVKVEV
jgi:hypothetical protein